MITFPSKPAPLLAVAAAIVMLQVMPASALPLRVWVSNAGVDSGTCGAVATPCRTFQQAHDNVAAGGTISVLNAGDYAPVAIGKSVNITNDGVGEAGIQAPGATAVNINAVAGMVVSLRGLVIDGAGNGRFGIGLTSNLGVGGIALHVQNCVIRNFQGSGPGFPGFGIGIFPSGSAQVFVSDTLVYNNGSIGTSGGVIISPVNAGSVNAILSHVQLENNLVGIQVAGLASHVSLLDSSVVGNAGDGVLVNLGNGAPGAVVFVDGTTVVNNTGSGLHANGVHAVILLSDSDVTNNGTGVSITNGGQLITYGDNENNNNVGAEGAATGTFGLF
jgi:hypothetical protein